MSCFTQVVAQLADRVLYMAAAQYTTYKVPIKQINYFSDGYVHWIYLRVISIRIRRPLQTRLVYLQKCAKCFFA